MNRDFVRVVCCVLGLVGIASGQLKVPEKGWTLVQKGDGKTEGERTLGWWENEEKTITVGAAWSPKIPGFGTMLGLGPDYRGVDPFDWPKDAVILGEGLVGLRVDFKPEKTPEGEMQEHYWIYRQKGGVFLEVLRKDGAKFSPAKWIPDGLPVDPSEERLKELHDIVTRVKGSYVRQKFKIDPTEPLEEFRKRVKRVQMMIGVGGVFSFDGKVVDQKELEKRLSAVAQKFEKEKEVSKIVIVLDLVVAKGVEFRFVEQAVQIGKKAGIPEASFTSWTDLEWLKGK